MATAVFMDSFASFVFPIGVFGVLDVPEWPAAFNGGDFGEIVFRWRRTRGPLECPCIPGIVPGQLPFAQRKEDIHYKNQNVPSAWNATPTVQMRFNIPQPRPAS